MSRPFRKRPDAPRKAGPSSGATPWDRVADWYDRLVGERGSDYHRNVILPAALRILDVQPGERVLDACCGQGVLARELACSRVAEVVGVDLSDQLIAAARSRSAGDARLKFVVGDARELDEILTRNSFDAAACIMAVHDLAEIDPVYAAVARVLKPGGRFVQIMTHPCFRLPRQSAWGWDAERKIQYRRMDRYATAMTVPISIAPSGEAAEQTTYHHRPLADILGPLGRAGLPVIACEELYTHHEVEPGGRSRGENRSFREFPLFLALKSVRMAT